MQHSNAQIETIEDDLAAQSLTVFQAWLPLAEPWCAEAVDILRNRGWFLGGVLPRWFDSDGVMMQKIRHRPAWEAIQIHFDRAARLLEMVRGDWEAVSEGSGGPAD